MRIWGISRKASENEVRYGTGMCAEMVMTESQEQAMQVDEV